MKNQFLQLHLDNAKRQRMPVSLSKSDAGVKMYIYDVIDSLYGVSATDIISSINSIDGTPDLHLHINSPGGSVFEARAIIAALKQYSGKIIAHVDSLAASAATSIAIAANEVVISPGAFFMIHNASAVVCGDKNDMRDTANLLEKIEGSIIADYTGKTGKDESTITAWMDAETWFTADDAVLNGFCDRLEESKNSVSNTWNLSAFENAPKQIITTNSRSVSNRNKLRLVQSL